jgi:hypothetical protein
MERDVSGVAPAGGSSGMKSTIAASVLAILVAALSSGSKSDYLSAKHKFDLIEEDRLKPGSRVTLSQRELNAYVEEELPHWVPEGVRNPKVELGAGSASASALVDFVKIRQAQGKPPGWLMAKLLEGEHAVNVTVRITSGSGKATVDVERVEIGGVAIEGRMLEYLIRNYLIPIYPEAKVGEPFVVGHRIERVDVRPSVVTILIAK